MRITRKHFAGLAVLICIVLSLSIYLQVRSNQKNQAVQEFLEQLLPFSEALRGMNIEEKDYEKASTRVENLRSIFNSVKTEPPDNESTKKLISEAEALINDCKKILQDWKNSETNLKILESLNKNGASESNLNYQFKHAELSTNRNIAIGTLYAKRWDATAWLMGYNEARSIYKLK